MRCRQNLEEPLANMHVAAFQVLARGQWYSKLQGLPREAVTFHV
jgi:hypothetical protein